MFSFELTQDPTVIIVYREEHFLIYYSIPNDESWIIYGDCSHDGTCIDGAVNPDLRPYSERLDCPVRPQIECTCNLRGLYL